MLLDQMPLQDDGNRFDPRLRMYTPQNFLNDEAIKIKTLSQIYAESLPAKKAGEKEIKDSGYQLEQFRTVFEKAHNLRARKVTVGTEETARNLKAPKVPKVPKVLPISDSDKVISEMIRNLGEAENYIVANYSRLMLGQKDSGHYSPVAAYDETSHSFLILDVNPFAGPWVWVDETNLINAMNTFDTVENRGLLFLSEK